MKWYKAPKCDYFEGYIPTIKYGTNAAYECEINSKNGFIWKHSNEHYTACITNSRIANKLKNPEIKYKPGDECLITFPKEQLETYIKLLNIKNNRVTMIARANSFGS